MHTLFKKAICLLLTAAITIAAASAQDFYKAASQCLSYLENSDTAAFNKAYTTLFYKYCKHYEPSLKAATEATAKGCYDTALSELDTFVGDGFLADKLATDTDFIPLRTHKGWRKLQLKIDSINANHIMPLKKDLLAMQDKDQSIRLLLLEAEKQYGTQSEPVKRIRNIMKEVDCKNIARFEDIVNQYGWPGMSKLGEDGDQSMFLIIQHIDDEVIQEKYLAILKQAAAEGETEPWYYAFLTDRILMNKGKRQLYGTQVIRGEKPDSSYIVPLQNADMVDEWRAEVGLEPLGEYLEEFGLQWDKEAYKASAKYIEKRFEEYHRLKKAAD